MVLPGYPAAFHSDLDSAQIVPDSFSGEEASFSPSYCENTSLSVKTKAHREPHATLGGVITLFVAVLVKQS